MSFPCIPLSMFSRKKPKHPKNRLIPIHDQNFKSPTTRSIFKPGSVLTRDMTRPAPFLQLGFLLFPIIVIAQLEPFTNLNKTTKRNGIYWNLHELPCTTWYSYPFLLDIKVTNRVACSKRSDQTLLIYNTRARRSEGQIYLRDLILVPNL